MVNVKICVGSHCSLVGALNLVNSVEEMQKEFPEKIKVEKIKCLGVCKESIKRSPVVQINEETIYAAKNQIVLSKIMEKII